MGLPRRRFLNLIVNNHIQGARSLRQIDLTRHKLFNAAPPRPPNGNASESEGPQQQETTLSSGNPKKEKEKEKKLKTIRLPDPIFNFRSSPTGFDWYIDCLPLSNSSSKILCADQSGRTALFDADTRQAEAMPNLHTHKFSPGRPSPSSSPAPATATAAAAAASTSWTTIPTGSWIRETTATPRS
ncbi:unnamed protein product [Urochloa humidicola]